MSPQPTIRRPSENACLVSAEPIAAGQTKPFRDIFPITGEGYDLLRLIFHHAIVAGTAATPRTEGALLAIKNISFKTSRGEEPIDTPAMGLHLFNKLFTQVEPVYDAILAADGTYDAIVDLLFAQPFLARGEDTILDSSRYSHFELKITMGGLADMFATPGTATLATTVDIALMKSKTCMDPSGLGKPKWLPYFKHLPRFDVQTKKYVDIESATDLILFGFFAVAHDLASWGSTTEAFTGARADCLDNITWRIPQISFVDTQKVGWFKQERAHMAQDRAFTGVYPHIFTREGSYNNAFYTGGQSLIRFEVGSILGTPTTPQADLCIFGGRTLR